MKVEPKLKQRPARPDGRLGARVSASLSGLWRLACLVAPCPVEPAQAAVLEVGLGKPHPEPAKAIAAAPWPAGRFSDSATRPSEYACRRVFPFLALFHDSPCPASLPDDDCAPRPRSNASGRAARQLRYRKVVSFMALSTQPVLQKRHARLTRRLRQQELHSTKILRTYVQ
jgi:hypothetical protein